MAIQIVDYARSGCQPTVHQDVVAASGRRYAARLPHRAGLSEAAARLSRPRSSPERPLRRWFWLGLQAGTTAAVVFIHWSIFQSLYRIDALCPYCMVVWVVTIPLFWYTTLHNLRAGDFPTRRRHGARCARSPSTTGPSSLSGT